MGENFGYQHLWNLGSGDVEGSSLVSWLHGNSYYSLVTSAVEGSKVFFARLGANDPDFNLRSEPALILRQSGQNHVFASVLETHGYFNEEFEASVGARGLVESVATLADNDDATIIEVKTTSGNAYRFAISNRVEAEQDSLHEVSFGEETVSFTGSFAKL
ncbi:poly(beta-D-mannuronate) lyase [Vibrio variabilis]|uniref:Poly(Beta-D-mannuronate) lyase n=1 Tax=Vibrio variabilis TaxID=990271 RepID=A0ABQ0J8R9_9VIBR|nr:poly(beta-D-mannuronate) lyase [Vibrio variabilis]